MKQLLGYAVSVLALSVTGQLAFAGSAGRNGVCMSGGQQLDYNNAQVLAWKSNTPNQWKSRGFVSGVIANASDIYPDRNEHNHFAIVIGPDRTRDKIEIVYNKKFGQLPSLQPGMKIAVCGDYITASAPSGGYPASPNDAIIHWVHGSPSPRHEDGFVAVEGKIYGQLGDARR